MASLDRTAYPRLRAQLTDAELEADYTRSEDEAAFVRQGGATDARRCVAPTPVGLAGAVLAGFALTLVIT